MEICPTCQQRIEKKIDRNDIWKIIMIFKMAQGYKKDDKAWDRLYFNRYSKSAKQLLEFIGNWQDAADCVQDIYQKFTSMGLTVTFETIIKHSAEWVKDMREQRGSRNIPENNNFSEKHTISISEAM